MSTNGHTITPINPERHTPMSTPDRLRIATFPDGAQILITEWVQDNPAFVSGPHQRATAARRPNKYATWGPPVELEDAP